jgi:hypothetical protein
MRNSYFTNRSLQFSKLRISPWEIPSVLLLCSPLSRRPFFFLLTASIFLSLSLFFLSSWRPSSFPHRQQQPQPVQALGGGAALWASSPRPGGGALASGPTRAWGSRAQARRGRMWAARACGRHARRARGAGPRLVAGGLAGAGERALDLSEHCARWRRAGAGVLARCRRPRAAGGACRSMCGCAGAVQTATSCWWSVQEHVRVAPSGRHERARRWSFGAAFWRGPVRGQ